MPSESAVQNQLSPTNHRYYSGRKRGVFHSIETCSAVIQSSDRLRRKKWHCSLCFRKAGEVQRTVVQSATVSHSQVGMWEEKVSGREAASQIPACIRVGG